MQYRLLALLIPILALASVFAFQAPKERPDPRGYAALHCPKAPTIDGDITEDAWKAAPWSEDFADIEGDAKPKPTYRTRMKMLWDEKALYIAAELKEPHVWATITKHDEVIFQDPDFEVFIDPDGDNHNYAEMELNAKNTTWDLLLTKPYLDGGKAINAWEATGLKTAVKVQGTINDPSDTDTGWTVEIAWPWEGLKEIANGNFPPKPGDTWRINFSRVEWDIEIKDGKYSKVKGKPEHNWVWSPQGVIDMHRPERWGVVQFSAKEAGPVAFEADPSWPVQRWLGDFYDAQAAFKTKEKKYAKSLSELGLKEPPTGTATWDLTRSGYEATVTSGKKSFTIREDRKMTKE